MNILPKKSWHVRTKKNIARVRRDEAKAAEEEKETQRRIALAAQEARTALLRERASQRLAGAGTSSISTVTTGKASDSNSEDNQGKEGAPEELRFGLPLGSLKDVVQPDGHVNFFQDVEAGKRQGGVNEEYEDEKRQEQEEYEKKIGYLVYLGQDSLEHSKERPWYAKIDRGKRTELEEEVEKVKELDKAAAEIGGLQEKSKTFSMEEIKMTKSKNLVDPLKDIRKYLRTPGMKRKLDELPTSKINRSLKSHEDTLSSQPIKRKRSESPSTSRNKRHKKEKHKKHKKKSKKQKKTVKHKKRTRSKDSTGSESSSESSEDNDDQKKKSQLEKLRAERLQREREERRKAEQVLAKLRGEVIVGDKNKRSNQPGTSMSERSDGSNYSMTRVKQKYNSQFNPHLARQNFDD